MNSLRVILFFVFAMTTVSCLQDPHIGPSTPTPAVSPTPFLSPTPVVSPTPSSYTLTPAVRINYGNVSNRQHFDYYTAVEDASPRPLVLYVHGGAWVFGPEANTYESFIKTTVDFPCKNLTQNLINNGFAVAIMKYRQPKYFKKSTAQANIPYASSALSDIMNDIDAAVGVLVSQANVLKIDTNRIGILGDSAGAHLVSMYAYGNTAYQNKIKTVVTFYGPYDLSKPDLAPYYYSYPYIGGIVRWFQQPAASALFGNPASEDEDNNASTVAVYLLRAFDSLTGTFIANQASDIRKSFSPVGLVATKGAVNVPMTFALHGARDNLVNPNQLNYFKTALGAQDYTDSLADNKNARHLTAMITGFDHGFVSTKAGASFSAEFDAAISPKVIRWFNSRLK